MPAADREWLLGQLRTVQTAHRLPVIAIDYVAPGERDLARETAKRILALGFTPWVANPELDMLGVGRVEVLPRRVLVLTERPEDGGDFHTGTAQRFLGMPLNHLGYRYEILDPRTEALPAATLRGRYAGVVSWVGGGRPQVDQKVSRFPAAPGDRRRAPGHLQPVARSRVTRPCCAGSGWRLFRRRRPRAWPSACAIP